MLLEPAIPFTHEVTTFCSNITIVESHQTNSKQYTVDSRYLEAQGIPWNTSKYPYLDI